LIYPEPETSVSISRTWSGLSSNDGGGSNLQPARSDSPDLIDGGHEFRGYSPKGHFRQAGNARFTGLQAGTGRESGSGPLGADGLDDRDGGTNAAFDVEI
jgi:hypothetical protein